VRNVQLCSQYVGALVQIAPNEYSVSDPEAIKTIYGHGAHFTKVRVSALLELIITVDLHTEVFVVLCIRGATSRKPFRGSHTTETRTASTQTCFYVLYVYSDSL
jgi:hypothetical protein